MGGIVDGIFGGGDAASDAADVQAQSAAQAEAGIQKRFEQTREDLDPFRLAALPALQQYQDLLGLGGTTASNLTEDEIRQNLLSSGQFNLPGGGGGEVREVGSSLFIPENLIPGIQSGADSISAGQIALMLERQGIIGQDQADRITAGNLTITPSGGIGAGSGGVDEGALNQAIQDQLAQQTTGQSPSDAQQAAIDSLVESPGQRFIRERAQKGLLANASAIGGLGGGNVRSGLVQQGAGFAQQDLENRFSRLQALIGSGQNAAAQVGSFGQAAATNIGQLQQQAGQARASGILGQQQANAQLAQPLLSAGLGAAAGSGLFGAGAAGLAGGSAGAGALLGFFSDERLKEDIEDLDLEGCFNAVMEMPLKSWRYLEAAGLDRNIHLGPMAQDAPDIIKAGHLDGFEVLSLHDELMMIAGAMQYMRDMGMIKCH